jgi:hypothetical protein
MAEQEFNPSTYGIWRVSVPTIWRWRQSIPYGGKLTVAHNIPVAVYQFALCLFQPPFGYTNRAETLHTLRNRHLSKSNRPQLNNSFLPSNPKSALASRNLILEKTDVLVEVPYPSVNRTISYAKTMEWLSWLHVGICFIHSGNGTGNVDSVLLNQGNEHSDCTEGICFITQLDTPDRWYIIARIQNLFSLSSYASAVDKSSPTKRNTENTIGIKFRWTVGIIVWTSLPRSNCRSTFFHDISCQ